MRKNVITITAPVLRTAVSFIEPMFAQLVRELPDGGQWTYDAKLDGYRCLAANRDGRAVLWSRRGNGFTHRFAEIARACANLPADTLIDGEVIAIGDDGRCSLNALQHSRPSGEIQFYAFDLLVYRGRSVIRLPIEERRILLAKALARVEYPVLRSTPFDTKPADLIRA